MLALCVVITSSSSDIMEKHHKTGNQNFSDLLLTSQCISTLPCALTHAVDETTIVKSSVALLQGARMMLLMDIRWSQQHVQSLGC